MEIKPLKHYPAPDFPTRDILDVHPELLRRLPNRWRQSAVIGTALVAACGIVAARWGQTYARAADEPVARVAPIFQHGDGHGSYGCDAVNPPVFLAEDEARQVITAEFKRLIPYATVEFKADALVFRDFPVPETSQSYGDKPGTRKDGTLAIDGWDGNRKIGFEYVSHTDYTDWLSKDGQATWQATNTVDFYDFLGTAQRLRDTLADAKKPGAFAVFYDPQITVEDVATANGQADWKTLEENIKIVERYALREQVRDFVKWLKAEGVI